MRHVTCSEDVFNFSKDQLTSAKVAAMKDGMREEFHQIFQVTWHNSDLEARVVFGLSTWCCWSRV